MSTATATKATRTTAAAPKAKAPAAPKNAAVVFESPKPTAPSASREASTVRDTGVLGVISENREALGFMTPPAMKELLFISHYEATDPESPAPDKHGYQRSPIMERIPQIAKFYLDDDPTARTTPLVLSVRLREEKKIREFLDLFETGDYKALAKKYGKTTISVVDGQHRYLGIVEANRIKPSFNPQIPVQLNFGLTFEDEAKLFDVVNSTQRKLPRALIESTKVDVTEVGATDHSQRIRLIAYNIATHEDSPWKGLVNMTGGTSKLPVTFEGVRRSTGQMFPKELLERLTTAERSPEEVSVKYWSLVAEACAVAWNDTPRTVVNDEGDDEIVPVKYRIKELVGLAGLSKLGQNIITSALEHADFDKRMAELVGKLKEVDWEKSPDNPWMSRQQAGMAGQPGLHTTLYRWVYSGIRPR